MARPSPSAGISAVALTLLLFLQLLLLLAPASTAAAPRRGAIKRRQPPQGPSFLTILNKWNRQTKASGGSNYKDPQLGSAAADDAGYVVLNVSIGPARQTFSGVVNIADDFVWVQCPPAPAPAFSRVPCASQTCQSTLNITADDCGTNSTGGGDCEYIAEYAGGNTTGYLAEEAFTLVQAQPVTGGPVVFGCSDQSTVNLDGVSGIVGFSRGNLSLISQLNISRFSYVLTPDDSGTTNSDSIVRLGDAAVPQTKRSRSTPLLRSNAYPELYYVKLTSIQVDGVALSGIPAGVFDLTEDGNSGGVFMSTTTPVTFLQEDAYKSLKQALMSKIRAQVVNGSTLSSIFDLCYTMQSVAALTFPKLTLVFDGGDAPAMDLTTVHYFYKDNDTGLQCLTILPMPPGTPFSSVLGSMLQAGTNMIYDIGGGQLTFEKGAAALAPSKVSIMAIASVLLAWVLLL